MINYESEHTHIQGNLFKEGMTGCVLIIHAIILLIVNTGTKVNLNNGYNTFIMNNAW